MKIIEVALGERSYAIEIGTGLLEGIGEKLRSLARGNQVALITDSLVGPYYEASVKSGLIEAGFEVITVVIPEGESSKSWSMAEHILTTLLKAGYHRDCSIMALGGGVVGDLAGFVAAIYQRGVDFYQVPTSLLAQVDSSVGGKVAVNHPLGKNMIGAFHQPKAVWIDLDTLETLVARHWQNGLAEVIKYGMIADRGFFQFLQENRDAINAREFEAVSEMIAHCCHTKALIVAADEQEMGIRATLNFGHTIGHGLEMAGGYQLLLHGEAVAIGMVLASQYAQEQGMCIPEVVMELVEMLEGYCLPTTFGSNLAVEQILGGMALDKKVENDQWVMILPKAIGQVTIVKGVSPREIASLLTRKKGD